MFNAIRRKGHQHGSRSGASASVISRLQGLCAQCAGRSTGRRRPGRRLQPAGAGSASRRAAAGLSHRSRAAGAGADAVRPHGRHPAVVLGQRRRRPAQRRPAGPPQRAQRAGQPAGRQRPGGAAAAQRRLCAAQGRRAGFGAPGRCRATAAPGQHRRHAGRGARDGPGRTQRHHRGLERLPGARRHARQGRAGAQGHPAICQCADARATRRHGHHRPARCGQQRDRRDRRARRGAGHGDLGARLPDRFLAIRRRADPAQLLCAGQLGHRGHGLLRPARSAARRLGPAAGHGQPGRRGEPGAQARPGRRPCR